MILGSTPPRLSHPHTKANTLPPNTISWPQMQSSSACINLGGKSVWGWVQSWNLALPSSGWNGMWTINFNSDRLSSILSWRCPRSIPELSSRLSSHMENACRTYRTPLTQPCQLCVHLWHQTEKCVHFNMNGTHKKPQGKNWIMLTLIYPLLYII